MLVNNLKETLNVFWYLFLICLLVYLTISIIFNIFKSIKDEKEKEELLAKLIEKALKNDKNE